MQASLNTALMKIETRAEKTDPSTLVETFVDVGPLFTVLHTPNNQVIYGRRGTGKTHALKFLAQKVSTANDVPIYLDLRTIGSTGGLYSDTNIPISERGTRLLADSLAAVHEELKTHAVEKMDSLDPRIFDALDEFADEITKVVVEGQVSTEESEKLELNAEETLSGGITLGLKNVGCEGRSESKQIHGAEANKEIKHTGVIRHRIHFGAIGTVLRRIVDCLNGRKIWLLLDEWSVVPFELQPLLADLLRRSVFPVKGLIVKIGAIEQRCKFQNAGSHGDYVGIELGADAAADLNLDDFMVFDNDETKAINFFENLIFKHFRSVALLDHAEIASSRDLILRAFTKQAAFKEFVRATEGVPRDAIYLLSQAARDAFDTKISIENVRKAAKTWYQRDKDNAVSANPKAKSLLHKIIDRVIGHRQARAFLFRGDMRHELIDELFDKRVLHILKRNIAAHDQPGIRYDVYKIDYGCYVDLLVTNKAPKGLLPTFDDEDADAGVGFVDVPPDDYRAIRRAILTFEDIK